MLKHEAVRYESPFFVNFEGSIFMEEIKMHNHVAHISNCPAQLGATGDPCAKVLCEIVPLHEYETAVWDKKQHALSSDFHIMYVVRNPRGYYVEMQEFDRELESWNRYDYGTYESIVQAFDVCNDVMRICETL